MEMTKPLKDFTFASIVMTGVTRPLSGRTAYIPVPDGLFPLELLAFAMFGSVFLVASFYHFRLGLRAVSYGVPSVSSSAEATERDLF